MATTAGVIPQQPTPDPHPPPLTVEPTLLHTKHTPHTLDTFSRQEVTMDTEYLAWSILVTILRAAATTGLLSGSVDQWANMNGYR
ncbi:hypothetical protein Ntsu_25760 [Nocardia sp. IFM 10818]